ncbi:MAG: nucleotidyltransferase [Zetaproteobacteria bacterium CG_4_9_14_3_um_filter_49_83]|nr:MAG: nucleotidyltransferase [Zetaproteobacteria bacterium CG1_02_49_23]PIQ31334.1 MAG: nucleotidyltransferase [Zetaproteobacteria bacterium CG17_big_fil_post_rev_8_21_14_2_50_50_13]PIV30879.1 MAG: nucleotidyltransferase [Zetaproteobacteria bacterium CG02_land_8_20_14_3_00_50_9]PIY55364.1 MAG: nucleotidyltransferase [Zetaproteobacteria bacterium CG_4_10_14_0_8_um_filter_49_80]PJA34944.1 MAG: nucleotidyltransferase [Zetaproteobacteria bacterium CG_4_9_14_3_um_filter_49_83]
MENHDIRWIQRLHNYTKALAGLQEASQLAAERALSKLEKQGVIQGFEFTHELAWKTLKDFLESRGQQGIYGSKDATRLAFKLGIIHDGDVWMQMIEQRNRSVYTYNEKDMEVIFKHIINQDIRAFESLLTRLQEEMGAV